MKASHVLSGGRYPVLRALAIMYVIGAALAVVSTVVTLGYILLAARFAWTDKLIMAVGTVAAGFFLIVSMLAIAEVLKLCIDIEHNTRMSVPGRIGVSASVMPEQLRDDNVHVNRLNALDEESAEAALIRGH